MAFIECPGIAEVKIRYAASSVFVGENTMYFRRTDSDPISAAYLLSLMGQLQNAMVTEPNLYWSTGVQVERFDGRDLTTEAGAVATLDGDVLTAGASTGALLPANVTVAVAFKSGVAGRSYRGRNYCVGLTEAMVTGDYLISPFDARIITLYTSMADAVLGVDFEHVVLSRYHAGAPRAEGIGTPVLAWQLTDLRVDTMKSRLNH